jgi:nitrile hydratase
MNGGADLGGMHGFGPIAPDPDEPLFHDAWERRVFALTLAMGASGTWTIDESRFARESLPPPRYLDATYYQIWFMGLTRLLLAHGLVGEAELASGKPAGPPAPVKRVLEAGEVAAALAKGAPVERAVATLAPAAFAPGDRVRVRLMNPARHTRAPRYVRGRVGTITAVHGVHVFPDSNAHGNGEAPSWLYGVSFAAHDLWGPDTTAAAVSADLWEPYLEPADTAAPVASAEPA